MPCFKEENKPKDYMYFKIIYDYDFCLPFMQTVSGYLLEKNSKIIFISLKMSF